jgi:hypothetical protein
MLLVACFDDEEQRGESGVALIREKRPEVAVTECGGRGHLSHRRWEGAAGDGRLD